jgi:putative Holliday junction resolvase
MTEPVTRLLGIDLGERRVGLAIADLLTGARPLTTIRRGRSLDDDARTIERVMREQRATELVVGLPLEASGDEGPQAQLTRDWADAIATRLGVPMTLRDERLSSRMAEERIGPMKRGRSGGPPSAVQRDAYRARIDREAAAILLQHEVEARAATGATRAPSRGATVPRDASDTESSR